MQQYWKGIGSYGTVGLEFALSVLFGGWIGHQLDRRWESEPWLTLVFGGCGLAAGVRALWRVTKKANREAERERDEQQHARRQYHDEP